MSSKGIRLLKRARGPFTGVLPEALCSLDKNTLGRLDRDLGSLIKLLGSDQRGARIPLGDGRVKSPPSAGRGRRKQGKYRPAKCNGSNTLEAETSW